MPFAVIDPSTAEPIVFSGAGPNTGGLGRTLTDFSARLRIRLGNRTDADAYLTQWVNSAYQKVWNEYDLEEKGFSLTFDTVAGQPFYLLPETIITTRALALVDEDTPEGGWPLRKIDLFTYRKLQEDDQTDPSAFFRHQQVLVLWPTPPAIRTMSLEGNFNPVPLSISTHQTVLGTRWDDVVQEYAAFFAHTDLSESGLAAVALNNAVAFGRSILTRMGDEQEGMEAGIQPVRSFEEFRSEPVRPTWAIPRRNLELP